MHAKAIAASSSVGRFCHRDNIHKCFKAFSKILSNHHLLSCASELLISSLLPIQCNSTMHIVVSYVITTFVFSCDLLIVKEMLNNIHYNVWELVMHAIGKSMD
jgi:hypothetical protein